MAYQKRKFSVLCRKRYESFNFEVRVGVDVLHRKLSNVCAVPWGVFSTVGGVQYRGGYHEYRGGIS